MAVRHYADETERMLARKFGLEPDIDPDELERDAEAFAQREMDARIAADFRSRSNLTQAEAGYLGEP